MREHALKCWPREFDAVLRGIKRFEYRRDDRGGFALADVLRLREYRPEAQAFTGRETLQLVTYILQGGEFGVPDGYVILGIEPLGRS